MNQRIVADIQRHVADAGGGAEDYAKWYCGISADPTDRLFRDHRVSREEEWWIYRKADSTQDARETERHLLDQGFQGGSGGGDAGAVYVYAYQIVPGSTRE